MFNIKKKFQLFVVRIFNKEFHTSFKQHIDVHDAKILTLFDNQRKLDKKIKLLLDLKERKESDDPWVELMGGDVDSKNGLELNLDWNEAFIQQLRARGYKGAAEGDLVAQWLQEVQKMIKTGPTESENFE